MHRPRAAGAAVLACRMAERTGTSCQLVHATPDVLASADVPGNDPYRRVMLEEARTSILAALAEAVPVWLLDTLTVRLGGAPVVLQRVAAERGAEHTESRRPGAGRGRGRGGRGVTPPRRARPGPSRCRAGKAA